MSSNGRVLAARTSTQIIVYSVKVKDTQTLLQPRLHFPFPSSQKNEWANAFRLLPDNRLFLCAQKTCTLFELDLEVGAEKVIFETTFDLTIGSWTMVPLEDRFVLRTVSDDDASKAYITTLNFQGEQLALAKDYETIQHLNGVFGFETNDHFFFMDTVIEEDRHVYEYITKINHGNITRARLTRVCKNDATKDLITRMDIHLGCGPHSENYREYPRLAVANAFLSDNKQTLFVAFQREDANQMICGYSMQEVNDYFEKTWDDCQDVRNPVEDYANCPKNSTCFTFSWKIPSRQHKACLRYRNDVNSQTYKNCEIGGDLITLDRIGWLENFSPLWKNHEANYTGIFQYGGYEEQTFFMIDENNTLHRLLRSQPYAPAFWSTPAKSFAVGTRKEGEKEVAVVFYTMDNQIGSHQISCPALYDNCSAIRWDDPLNCGFCSFPAAAGYVSSISDNRTCLENGGRLLVRECPPKIIQVTVFKNQFHIVMENLEQFENVHIQICNNEVNYERKNNLLKGSLDGFDYDDDCEVIVYGDLRSAPDFAIQWLKENTTSSESPSPGGRAGRKTKVVVGVIAAVVFTIIIAVIGYAIWTRRNQNEEESSQWELPSRMHPYKSVSTTESETQLNIIYDIPKLPANQFETIKLLGKGHFGSVTLCRTKGGGPDVAVKEIHGEWHSMHQELRLIGQCQDPNIVRCFGYYRTLSALYVVMEYLGGGDLHQFLINSDKQFTAGDALSFVKQIASGMKYLASKNIIHRDLAARNCMLDVDEKIVKITDFGLGRKANTDGNIYWQMNMETKLPWRWTALECLQVEGPQFSEKTDVWSFGVVMWETFSRANHPYPDISKLDNVESYLRSGHRLKYPGEGCPVEVYELMKKCWLTDPDARPTFHEIYYELGDIIQELDAANDEYYATYLKPRPVSNAGSVVTSRDSNSGYILSKRSPPAVSPSTLKTSPTV